MAARQAGFVVMAALLAAAAAPLMTLRAAPALDYEFFKARVQPVFLQKRDGHTPLLRLPCGEQQRVPAGAALRRREHLERGAVAQELRDGVDSREPR